VRPIGYRGLKFTLGMVAVLVAAYPTQADVGEGALALKRGDYEVAVKEFKSAATSGNEPALRLLGHAYVALIRETAKRHGAFKAVAESAIRDLEPFAERGNKDALYWIGEVYTTLVDHKEALKWYRKAAEQGHDDAQWLVGNKYLLGEGVEKNYYRAKEWFEKAASSGNQLAQEDLGRLYAGGKGVSKNYSTAIKWFQDAIEHGSRGALFALGSMYETGKGLDKDVNKATELYNKAAGLGSLETKLVESMHLANKGDAEAQYWVGFHWLGGIRFVEDVEEGLRWYHKAAAQGHIGAINGLGSMYQDGYKVPQDFVLAHAWYNIGASLGDEKAKWERDQLARRMTPSQIAEAQSMARKLVESRGMK
jgi:uncharacterized protein